MFSLIGKFFIGFGIFLLNFSLNASSLFDSIKQGHVEVSGNVGGFTPDIENSSLAVTSTETDLLLQTRNPNFIQLGLGLAYAIPLNQTPNPTGLVFFKELKPTLNLRYSNTRLLNHAKLGAVYQYQDPDMYNYDFAIPFISTRFMFDMLFTVVSLQKFSLFLNGGVGPGWTKTGYEDKAHPDVMRGDLSLNNKNEYDIVTEVGAGLTYSYNNNFSYSLEYLYTNFGRVGTASHGILDGSITVIGPAEFKLHTQAILLGIHVTV